MAAALAASKILKKLSEEGSDTDEGEEMVMLANHYEKHAMGKTQKSLLLSIFINFCCVCTQ